MRFFDSHCHLQDVDFQADRQAVLARARRAGVSAFLWPASSVAESREALELVMPERDCYLAIGQHPHEAGGWSASSAESLREIYAEAAARARESGREQPIRAIGEIGLDYHYDLAPREVQRAVFSQQIRLAHDLQLPLVIHEREAFQDTFTILEEAQREGLLAAEPGVIHCFSGSRETALRYAKLGFLLGFDGPISFSQAKKFREIVPALTLDQILVETDAPFLSPTGFRGQRNEPSRIPLITLHLAELFGCDFRTMAEATDKNARRLFGLVSA